MIIDINKYEGMDFPDIEKVKKCRSERTLKKLDKEVFLWVFHS